MKHRQHHLTLAVDNTAPPPAKRKAIKKKPSDKKASFPDRLETLGMLLYVAYWWRYRPGWVAHTYKELYGEWPRDVGAVPPVMPTRQLLNWVEQRQQAWLDALDEPA
jgi:hypothetical protein